MKEPKIAFCLRVRKALKEAIERQAEQEQESQNKTIVRILEDYFGRGEDK